MIASYIMLLFLEAKSTVLKVLQVNRRLGKLVEKLVEKEWKYLYGIDLITKVEWSKLCFDDMWTKISLSSTKENFIQIYDYF